MDQFALWRRTLANQSDGFDHQRETLRQAFAGFRDRVKQLVGEVAALLPGLTVHDITHIDALWRVANEVAGPAVTINAAEAFVLGGAFLIHDAAHVVAAYEEGIAGIKRSIEWKDVVAQRFDRKEPPVGSSSERLALFQVLRDLHATQARHLLKQSWRIPSTGDSVHLLEHFQLRDYYGDLIGEIAASHHWPAHRVAEVFRDRHLNTPAFLAPARWQVDPLKIAFLLRTADVTHIDGQRAPWFLFALRQPEGISEAHWTYQAKMGQPFRTDQDEIRLTSGSPFGTSERQAWWLAYETARLIDRELRDARTLMRDAGRETFAASSVQHAASPEAFATNVRTDGWEPVDVVPKIGDVARVIEMVGGARLYGDRPELALRELIQNAADAVRALRALDELGVAEGEIEVALEREGDSTWLHVTDTGIGMSRYVLAEVLLDFGHSLWGSESVRSEIPGLLSSGFKPTGRFGIGFFSVFMLGPRVVVTTRRFRRAGGDDSDQWLLEFGEGLAARPTLRRPPSDRALRRSGTRVSVLLSVETFTRLLNAQWDPERDLFERSYVRVRFRRQAEDETPDPSNLAHVVGSLCPTLDVTLKVRNEAKEIIAVITPHDWETMEPDSLSTRLYKTANVLVPRSSGHLIDLRETSGVLVGRLSYGGITSFAVVTNGGLRNGALSELAGVILGRNNADIVRLKGSPIASREAWTSWASNYIDSQKPARIEALIGLHPLCPKRDLAVYRVGREHLTEAQVSEWVRSREELHVIQDVPTYEDYDDVSQGSFDSDLEMRDDLLILPSTNGLLEAQLVVPKVAYWRKSKALLQRTWGSYEEFDEDDFVVGDVNGTDITRTVTYYARREPGEARS